MSFFFGKKKTPAELLRENKRMIDKSIRELDRERTQLQNQVSNTFVAARVAVSLTHTTSGVRLCVAAVAQEKKLITEIKQMAKKNQMGAVKVMAKDLVRTRHSITKFYALRSQLQGVSLRIQTLKSTHAMGQVWHGIVKAAELSG